MIRVGTAGWSVSSRYLGEIASGGTHLERYARAFPIVEITSSFYRHHQKSTYERWARSVGADFRFCVKVPKALTHAGDFATGSDEVRDRFLSEVEGLGEKLGVLLVQLPGRLEFDPDGARRFFEALLSRLAPAVRTVCEPRHESWAAAQANDLLSELGIARAAVDPAQWTHDALPGGNARLVYFRLHGSPRIYYSEYEPECLLTLAGRLRAASEAGSEVWCIFDNTAHGHAIGNALQLQAGLRSDPP